MYIACDICPVPLFVTNPTLLPPPITVICNICQEGFDFWIENASIHVHVQSIRMKYLFIKKYTIAVFVTFQGL